MFFPGFSFFSLFSPRSQDRNLYNLYENYGSNHKDSKFVRANPLFPWCLSDFVVNFWKDSGDLSTPLEQNTSTIHAP
jgi:hypothetical protein